MSRLEIVYVPTDDLLPYENNPRDNDHAVEAVAKSMLEFGFRVPLTVGDDRVIDTGHTRVRAAKYIMENYPDRAEEFSELPVIFNSDLTEEQRRAFRLVDNKTAELATWDFDLLAGEVSALQETGIPLTEYGWTQEEIDCLNNVVAMDCLTNAEMGEGGDRDVENEPDGVDSNIRRAASIRTTKDGTSVRFMFGDFAFYILREDYDAWATRLRQEHEFDMERVADHLANLMGLREAKDRRLREVNSGQIEEDGREVFDSPSEGADTASDA